MESQKRPKVGVGGMILRDGKVLLGKRKSSLGESTWGLVGGHLEYGERPEDAVAREVMEEVGLIVTSTKLICVSNIVAYGKHYVDLEFEVIVEPGEPQMLEPEKFEAWEWFDLNDLPEPLFEAARLALESRKTGIVYNS